MGQENEMTPYEKLREDVARAIAEVEFQEKHGHPATTAFVMHTPSEFGLRRADAAIAAVYAFTETPTEEMVERGQGCLDCVPINRCEQQAKQVWAGMWHTLPRKR